MDIDLSRIIIRKADSDDISMMSDYRLDYLTELQGVRSAAYKLELKKELENYFIKSMHDENFYAVLAEYEKKILAYGGLVLKHIPGDFSKASYIEGDILNMYTIPEARRKGISSLILAKLLKEAGEMGVSKVSLHTSKDGEQLYRKFGFSDPVYPVLEKIITST